jgi:Mce-associated membrane protein
MTSSYRQDYDKLFAVVKQNAPALKVKLGTDVIASGIVRSGDNRVAILLFVDQPKTDKLRKTPVVFHNQVTAYLNLVDGAWLVDCLVTVANDSCS